MDKTSKGGLGYSFRIDEECEVTYTNYNKPLTGSMSTRSTAIFKDPNVVKHLFLLHDKYVIFPADKAPINIVAVYK